MTIRLSATLFAFVAAASFLAGCGTDPPPRPTNLPPVVDIGPTTLPGEPLVMHISDTGGTFVDGWRIKESDIPRMVAIRHVTVVTVKGDLGAPYRVFLRVHDLLAGAGVTSITFVPAPRPPQ